MGEDLLATDPRLADDNVQGGIGVDYKNKVTVEVYVEAARYDVKTEAVLNILHRASNNEDGEMHIPRLPSWCPNFNTGRKTSILGISSTGVCAGFKDLALGVVPVIFRAKLAKNTNVLLVEVLHMDTVKDIQRPAWRWWDEAPEAEGISSAMQSLYWNDTCFEISMQTYYRPQDAIEAHSQTLIANTLNGRRCTSDQQDIYRFMRDVLYN
jgi:hypothetical protein